LTSEHSDSSRSLGVLRAEKLESVRVFLAQRDKCALRIGVAWLEFERLRRANERRVYESLKEEERHVKRVVNDLGIEGDKFRIDLETGAIFRVE